MKKIFLNYLFNHHYLVNQLEFETDCMAETRLTLGNIFNIRITEGAELLQPEMIRQAELIIGISVPKAFYRGFPESVRSLSMETLLIDQLLHYFNTYGMNNFDEAGHSVFEEDIERKAFNEKTPVKDFAVITETEAIEKLKGFTEDLLSGTRQLSDEQYALVLEFIRVYGYMPENCASKNTAVRLLIDTRRDEFAGFLMLSDVPKLADELNYRSTGRKDPKKLNLKNRNRRLLTEVIDRLVKMGKVDTGNCYEKKDLWSGLLHHIHYKTDDPKGIEFLNAMRGGENHSALSVFEKTLAEQGAPAAADVLIRRKRAGMLLRNIDYLLSRCRSDEEVRSIIEKIDTKNTIVLLQLMFHYYSKPVPYRSFKFIKYGMMRKHDETNAEMMRRRTLPAKRDRDAAASAIRAKLEKVLSGRLGKVYIDPKMKRVALPVQEGAGQGGFGTLSKGSRIPLPEGKKIRGCTYWEKVNDIDLSVIGLDGDLHQTEFSWRTMAAMQSSAITYSGDQTSGYSGGSEFFDVDPDQVKKLYPKLRYLIFCNNIYTGGCKGFKNIVCRAGYMLRDIIDSGEIFEPKTVSSSFIIDSESRFAYLFGIDLQTNDFVWLNIAVDSRSRIAGQNDMSFLVKYFEMTEIISVYDFFAMMASEMVDDAKNADIAVTDDEIETGEDTEIIRSYDSERMIALLNQA